MTQNNPWPPGSVVYQIYPRSFRDSDSNGIGDLRGITQKLDYLAGRPESLGVDAIWLSPVYTSPMADMGYDVADYCNIDPLFGTMEDFEALLQGVHTRGMKLLMDFVPNHTSNQHPWFVESRSSRTSPKRDWYVWRDAQPDGSPPNNWLSAFDGSAWQFDEQTGQYYLHTFLTAQPDLNWDNPAVRAAMHDVLRFWLDKGVDGFRVDAVYWLAKDQQFRDDPVNEDNTALGKDAYDSLWHAYSRDQPELYEYLKELATVVGTYKNRRLVVEAYPERDASRAYARFYHEVDPAVLAPFNFSLLSIPWQADRIKDTIDEYQQLLQPGDNPVYVLGNHDTPRLASRIGSHSTRQAALLLLTLPGTPFMYYGDELGIGNVVVPAYQSRDASVLAEPTVNRQSRDPERTPMQWTAAAGAGFSSHVPWLPFSKKYRRQDVATELLKPESLLNLYRKLLRLRHAHPALQQGAYVPIVTSSQQVFAFARQHGSETLTVCLNVSSRKVQIDDALFGDVLLSTATKIRPHALAPYEARIIRSA